MINSPTELSNCVIWLDGADSSTMGELSSTGVGDVTNGDPVGLWQNKASPFIRNFSSSGQANTTRPTYISSLSCLRFVPNQFLTDSTLTPLITSQTIFMMLSIPTSQSEIRAFTQIRPGDTNDFAGTGFIRAVGINGTNFYFYGEGAARISAPLPSLSTINICCAHHSGNLLRYLVNGASGGTFSPTTTLSQSASNTRIGSGFTTGLGAFNSFTGNISEVIVYNRALTNAEREDVEYYLSRKWSVLNSIPRQVYALRSGNWSDSTLWSVSADPVPWNVPIATDNVYTNSFTVTANTSTRVDTIRNSTLAPNILSGGSFWLANGVSLSANRLLATIPITTLASSLVTLLPSATAAFVGLPCVNVGTNTSALCCINGHLTIYGNVSGGVTNTLNTGTIITDNNSTLVVYGSAIATGAIRYQGSNMNINIFGDVISTGDQGQASVPVYCPQSGRVNNTVINVVGNLYGGPSISNYAVLANFQPGGTVTVNVTGDLYGGSGLPSGGLAVSFNQNIGINIRGNLYGSSTGSFTNDANSYSAALINDRGVGGGDNLNIPVYIKGSLFARNSMAIRGITNVLIEDGAIAASNLSPAIFWTTTTYAVSTRNCNIINAPNGRQAIYAPRYQVFPTSSPTYTRHAVNGYDSFVDYWTSDATFSYPSSSNVAQNVLYSNNTLSGSMIVPPVSSVFLGVPVQLSKGTLVPMTPSSFWNTSINSLSASDSIGLRLKNITTTEALSSIVKSLVYQ